MLMEEASHLLPDFYGLRGLKKPNVKRVRHRLENVKLRFYSRLT